VALFGLLSTSQITDRPTFNEELDGLKQANTLLKQKLHLFEVTQNEMKRLRKEAMYHEAAAAEGVDAERRAVATNELKHVAASTACPESTPAPEPAVAGGMAEMLLKAHAKWDWRMIATERMQPWPTITKQQLLTGVKTCNASAMYCQRMQIYKGALYLTDYAAIFFDRHYAPARVMPILETLRRHPNLPDIDIVVAGNDEPRVPAIPGDHRSWTRTCERWPGGRGDLPPVVFSPTVNPGVLDLPWFDFAWFFPRRPHKLRTAPWSVLHAKLLEDGSKVKWADKFEIAMHTGNVGSPHRKVLSAVAANSPDEMLVNELFIGDHGKIRQTCEELNLHRKGGFQQHKCYMTFEQQCRYKYLLNSASIGYANKFKSLLLCGSVVLYVREGMRHKEFYEFGLLPGVHYVAVDTAKDVPAMVRWLRQNDDYARAVAAAGRARMSSLNVGAVTDFMAELLTQYASRQAFRVEPLAGAVRIECEDDLWRHYALSMGWARAYMKEDNGTCVHPPPPGATLGPPGWGGAYRGSKPRCIASHDLGPKAQPFACNFSHPFSTAESWEPEGVFPKPHPANRENWMGPASKGLFG